jgi:hypothetical protein
MNKNSFRTYGKVLTLFSTARFPEEGKPLGNNNRLWEVKDPNFGIGYKLEHYGTPVATRFPEVIKIHRGALDSMTSKSRLGQCGVYVHERKEAAEIGHAGKWYIWPGEDLLLTHDKVFRIKRKWNADRSNLIEYYVLEHPVIQAKAPRKLPKGRNTLRDPKIGDAFEHEGKHYVWVDARKLPHGGGKGFAAVRYLGDNGWWPSRVHVPDTANPEVLHFLDADNPLSFMAWAAIGSKSEAIERHGYDITHNPTLEVPNGSEEG